jgi:hypothetical protein
MPDQWISKVDTIRNNKRFVQIEDTVNNRLYENYFAKDAPDSSVIARFKTQARDHRAEIAAKKQPLDLSNFEAGL